MADIDKLANMTDEEFMKYEESGEQEPESSSNEPEQKEEETDPQPEETEDSSTGSEPEETEKASDEPTEPESKDAKEADESKAEGEQVQVPALENAEQYEQFYKQVMAPIKANGKLIKLNSANDVVSLIQQGANYTKKMQSIAPYRKQLKMLEDNDLLDNDKLRFLIDVSRHDKDAIKKLLSDAKLDASDLAYDEELDDEGNPKPVQYYPKTPNVSDQEVAWSEAWKDLLEQEKLDNVDTHTVIMNMDAASQKQVYENPQILGLMHMTQTCGAYDKIIAEMDRLKTLGYIKENTPFLSTFVEVKNYMLQNGLLDAELKKLQQPSISQQTFVRQPAPTKKSTVSNNKQARAAAPSRSTGKSTKPFLNPLNMSDEEFLKHYDEI